MKTFFPLHRPAFALAASILLLASCSKTDTPAPTPVADHGQVNFINAASHIAPTTLRFLIDNTEKASQAYGTSSGYQSVPTGAHSVLVMAGTQTALSQSGTFDKDKSYTFVATPSASTSSVGGLLLTDDLTVPGTGKSRIRLVNLGQSTPTPLRLSQITSTVNGPVVADIVTNVANGSASSFVEFNSNIYTLSVLDNAGNTVAVVGDGTGAGTGVFKYTEGKIYTVVLSGTMGSLNSDQKVKAYLTANN